MGYGDWTELEIKNKSGKELSLRNCQHEWGKFYFCESGCTFNPRFLTISYEPLSTNTSI